MALEKWGDVKAHGLKSVEGQHFRVQDVCYIQ